MIPLLLPIAVGYGIDPVHLGIIFLANMQIGYFTPPVGMNFIVRKTLARAFKAGTPPAIDAGKNFTVSRPRFKACCTSLGVIVPG